MEMSLEDEETRDFRIILSKIFGQTKIRERFTLSKNKGINRAEFRWGRLTVFSSLINGWN